MLSPMHKATYTMPIYNPSHPKKVYNNNNRVFAAQITWLTLGRNTPLNLHGGEEGMHREQNFNSQLFKMFKAARHSLHKARLAIGGFFSQQLFWHLADPLD